MSKQQWLLDFYRKVLSSMGVYEDDKGFLQSVWVDPDDGEQLYTQVKLQVSVDGVKRKLPVKLPTNEVLKEGDFNNVAVFHPAYEDVMRGESEMSKLFRSLIEFKLMSIITSMYEVLGGIAVDKDKASTLSPKQSVYLPSVSALDNKALNKALDSLQTRLMSIYIKRNGIHNSTKYKRVATANFVITESFVPDSKMIGKTDIGSKNKAAAAANLFYYIVPDSDMKVNDGVPNDRWVFASDESNCPNTYALLYLYAKIANHLNAVVWLYRKYVNNANAMRVPLDWVDDLEQLKDNYMAVPSMPYNIGSTNKGELVSPNQAAVANQAARPQPVEAPTPKPAAPVPVAQQPPKAPPASAYSKEDESERINPFTGLPINTRTGPVPRQSGPSYGAIRNMNMGHTPQQQPMATYANNQYMYPNQPQQMHPNQQMYPQQQSQQPYTPPMPTSQPQNPNDVKSDGSYQAAMYKLTGRPPQTQLAISGQPIGGQPVPGLYNYPGNQPQYGGYVTPGQQMMYSQQQMHPQQQPMMAGQQPYPQQQMVPGQQMYPQQQMYGNQPYPQQQMYGQQPYPQQQMYGQQPAYSGGIPGR